MSDGIQETCRKYSQIVGPCGDTTEITGEECGVDLEGIPDNDQTHELLEVARQTGSSTILSEADVLKADQQAALQKGVQLFLENARVLIESLRKPDPPEGCRR